MARALHYAPSDFAQRDSIKLGQADDDEDKVMPATDSEHLCDEYDNRRYLSRSVAVVAIPLCHLSHWC